METKGIAIMTVLALVFAGVGFIFVDGADADADKDLVITYDGMISYEDYAKLVGEGLALVPTDGKFAAAYVAVFDENVEITVLNMDAYKDVIKPFMKAGIVTIPFDDVAVFASDNGYEGASGATYDLDDLMTILVEFTSATADKYGEIDGGVQTVLTITGLDDKKAVEVGIIDETLIYTEEDLEAAVALAVAAFDGYLSPDEAQALADKAVEDYKAANPPIVDESKAQMWMIVAVFAIVAAVALAGFLAFTSINAKKKAKKKEQETE